jgi:hypothetical protein
MSPHSGLKGLKYGWLTEECQRCGEGAFDPPPHEPLGRAILQILIYIPELDLLKDRPSVASDKSYIPCEL